MGRYAKNKSAPSDLWLFPWQQWNQLPFLGKEYIGLLVALVALWDEVVLPVLVILSFTILYLLSRWRTGFKLPNWSITAAGVLFNLFLISTFQWTLSTAMGLNLLFGVALLKMLEAQQSRDYLLARLAVLITLLAGLLFRTDLIYLLLLICMTLMLGPGLGPILRPQVLKPSKNAFRGISWRFHFLALSLLLFGFFYTVQWQREWTILGSGGAMMSTHPGQGLLNSSLLMPKDLLFQGATASTSWLSAPKSEELDRELWYYWPSSSVNPIIIPRWFDCHSLDYTDGWQWFHVSSATPELLSAESPLTHYGSIQPLGPVPSLCRPVLQNQRLLQLSQKIGPAALLRPQPLRYDWMIANDEVTASSLPAEPQSGENFLSKWGDLPLTLTTLRQWSGLSKNIWKIKQRESESPQWKAPFNTLGEMLQQLKQIYVVRQLVIDRQAQLKSAADFLISKKASKEHYASALGQILRDCGLKVRLQYQFIIPKTELPQQWNESGNFLVLNKKHLELSVEFKHQEQWITIPSLLYMPNWKQEQLFDDHLHKLRRSVWMLISSWQQQWSSLNAQWIQAVSLLDSGMRSTVEKWWTEFGAVIGQRLQQVGKWSSVLMLVTVILFSYFIYRNWSGQLRTNAASLSGVDGVLFKKLKVPKSLLRWLQYSFGQVFKSNR